MRTARDESTTAERRGPDREVFRRSLGYFAPERWWIALLVALIGVSVLVGLLEAWPVAVLIDHVLSGREHDGLMHRLLLGLLPPDPVAQIVCLVVMGAVIQAVGYATWAARMMINAHLNTSGTARVRAELFGKLQHLSLSFHGGHSQGDAIFRVVNDTPGPWGIVDTIIGTAVAAVTLVVMTVVLLSHSVPLTLAAYAVGPLLAGISWWFGRRILTRSLASRQADADLTSATQQALATVALAQAYGREPDEQRRFLGYVRRSVRAFMKLTLQQQLYPLSRDTLLAVAGAIVFGFGGYLVYRDQVVAPVAGGLSVGVLLVFMDYVRKLWEPLKWLTTFSAEVQTHAAAARRVFRITDTPLEVADPVPSVPLPLLPRTLALNDVSFRYPDGTDVLQGVSVVVPPGHMVAFLGASGTGKSTLLSLLLRLRDPDGGSIELDGTDLRQAALHDVRRHFALVAQGSPMLPVSVGENIAYGRPEATPADIVEAATLAGAHDFIGALPDGYATILSEGGVNISGGQRQRIAIAQALLTRAPIILLDEPTSALDPDHERQIVETLETIRRRRTIILVTHRIETTKHCDEVFELRAGRIVGAA